jgi:hypothetical protein
MAVKSAPRASLAQRLEMGRNAVIADAEAERRHLRDVDERNGSTVAQQRNVSRLQRLAGKAERPIT